MLERNTSLAALRVAVIAARNVGVVPCIEIEHSQVSVAQSLVFRNLSRFCACNFSQQGTEAIPNNY